MSRRVGNIDALNAYNKISVHSGIENASPHRLIQMLMEGALSRISKAKGHMLANEVSQKGKEISTTISIIEGLRTSLDMKQGGEIAENLESLYEYMTYKLMEANLHNSVEKLDEVHGLLMEIKFGWDGIKDQANQASQAEPKKMVPAA